MRSKGLNDEVQGRDYMSLPSTADRAKVPCGAFKFTAPQNDTREKLLKVAAPTCQGHFGTEACL